MIKNIVFDWSGVIVNNIKAAHQASNAVLKAFGVEENSLDKFQDQWEAPYMKYYWRYIPDLTLEEEKRIYKKSLAQFGEVELYPGVVETLNQLQKSGIKMVVLSSEPAITLTAEMKKYNLTDFFQDVILDIHDKGEVIKDLVNKHSFHPAETVIIGDTTHEIKIGQDLGLITMAVTSGFQKEEKLKSANPDYIIEDIRGLPAIVAD